MIGAVSFTLALFLHWIPQAFILVLHLAVYAVQCLCGLTPPTKPSRQPTEDEFKVVVIGAGFSGLAIGIRLKEAGIPFVIVERAAEVGGTWYHNSYPGCACDIESQLYSYSFEPNPNWSRVYPPQGEILAYLKHIAQKYDLMPYIRLNTNVNHDQWNEKTSMWELNVNDNEVLRANVVVNAAGALHVPNYPQFEGRESFQGESWHSAHWNHSVDYTNKRVGIIGSAASAIQAIPELAEKASHLSVFQRTPNWVIPKADGPITPVWKWIYRNVPFAMKLARWLLYAKHEVTLALAFNPSTWTAKWIRKESERYIRHQLRDHPELLKKMLPSYPMGCKRILLSNDFYRTLKRDNVSVHTSGIACIEPKGIRTKDGELIELDIIVYATGFRVLDGLPKTIGRGGDDLLERWISSSPEAYLGMTVPKYPNKFILLGPFTGLGHNSVVWMIECQVNYVMQAITHLVDSGLPALEVRRHPHDQFMIQVHKELDQTVWTSGHCKSWYQTKGGKIFALWPSFTFAYWWLIKNFDPQDFESCS